MTRWLRICLPVQGLVGKLRPHVLQGNLSVQAAITECHWQSELETWKFYFLQFWRLRSPIARHQQIWCLVRASFLFPVRSLSPVSSHWERGVELTGNLFIKTLRSLMRTPPSRHNHLPKPTPSLPHPGQISSTLVNLHLMHQFRWRGVVSSV